MEDGVERIVEQVVNPKIMSVIEPEVTIPYNVWQKHILKFSLLNTLISNVDTLFIPKSQYL